MTQTGGAAKLRIGELLVSRGLISNEQLEQALARQQREGGPLGHIILSSHMVGTLDFYDALTDHFRRGRIGDLLVEKGMLSEEKLTEAIYIQGEWGSRLGDIILAKGWVSPYAMGQTLADHFDKPHVD
ncbi:MAG: glycosyltransferase, partial [Zetaproteobacteria bacterium CG23_combo_of_CG06-09_8_20_14_all_54_7]